MNRLRVLWLSHFVPYPPKGGCFQRSYNLITRIGAIHELHLVAMRHKQGTHPEDETSRAHEELGRHCRSVQIVDISRATGPTGLARRGIAGLLTATPLTVMIFRSAEMREIVRSMMRRIRVDVIHLDTISLADYLGDLDRVATVMTHHGAESHMIRRRIRREPNWLKKIFFVPEWLTLQRYERRMCPRVGMNVAMSEVDRRILEEVVPDAKFTVVGNGVDVDYFTPVSGSSARSVVFAGRLDQYSNRDGILHFMREVWPGVNDVYPDAVINIIGNHPPEALRRLAAADSRIRVPGFVDDVRPYFREAIAAVCPIRDGGGTRVKILDNLAMGLPTVATSVGCEGLDVVPERDLLIADTPQDFVRQISRVFEDEGLRQRLSENARRLAEGLYSWDIQARKLMSEYVGLVAQHEAVRQAAAG